MKLAVSKAVRSDKPVTVIPANPPNQVVTALQRDEIR